MRQYSWSKTDQRREDNTKLDIADRNEERERERERWTDKEGKDVKNFDSNVEKIWHRIWCTRKDKKSW